MIEAGLIVRSFPVVVKEMEIYTALCLYVLSGSRAFFCIVPAFSEGHYIQMKLGMIVVPGNEVIPHGVQA